MRVSRAKAAENRARIVAEASRQFRARGFDGVGVDGLMKAVGLTHGGFYGHFESKDDLIAEALGFGLDDSTRRQADQTNLETFLGRYLSAGHRDSIADGCFLAALGADMARQSPAARGLTTRYVRAQIDRVADLVTGRTKAKRRARAIAAMSGTLGALLLARMVDDPDLSDEILASARAALAYLSTVEP